MDKDFGICGRNKEISEIQQFISDHVEQNKSGILYLTGPPGTGKTMSVNLVLNKVDNIGKIHLNCFKATSSKSVLTKIWEALNMGSSTRKNESEMIAKLASKLSGRTCKPFLMVLDEMDQLPKSSNSNLYSTLFSWTKLSFSKLIIVGIANTLNLTSRCQTVVKILGSEYNQVQKIIFRPYSSRDISSILNWYLENDENFEEALVDPKAIEMISKKFARDKGDIRGALNALRDAVDDVLTVNRQKKKKEEDERRFQSFPTPPSTPPPYPCKEKTNIASVANSVKKRQRQSHYHNDNALAHHEIILVCLHKFCSASKDGGVDKRELYGKVSDILARYGSDSSKTSIDASLEQLEMQGLLVFKKRAGMQSPRIILKASDSEVKQLAHNEELIKDFIY
uniref:Cell division control protein 6 n=1 Tax=Aceria tosichella TaxID=561515 RepID=A0A6G1SN60_9ACAR